MRIGIDNGAKGAIVAKPQASPSAETDALGDEAVIDFTIDIAPHGKGRPRAASIGGKARMFTPTKTRNWEATFAALAEEHRPAELLTGPLRVSITAYFPRPKRMSKRSKRTGEILGGFSGDAEPMTSRPDADNVAKSVLDALSGWYRDDAQVFYLTVLKFYHADGERPSVRVTIQEREPIQRREVC